MENADNLIWFIITKRMNCSYEFLHYELSILREGIVSAWHNKEIVPEDNSEICICTLHQRFLPGIFKDGKFFIEEDMSEFPTTQWFQWQYIDSFKNAVQALEVTDEELQEFYKEVE